MGKAAMSWFKIFDNPKVSKIIKVRKLQWIAHVLRMEDTGIFKRVFDGRSEKRKAVRKFRKRWADYARKSKNVSQEWRFDTNEMWFPKLKGIFSKKKNLL